MIPNGQSKIDNPEKVTTWVHKTKTSKTKKHNTICVGHRHTQDEDTKKTHNTICVGHHYAQTSTYNVNKP